MTRIEYLNETLEFYKDLSEKANQKLLAINAKQYEDLAVIFIEKDRRRTIQDIEYFNNRITDLKIDIENE